MTTTQHPDLAAIEAAAQWAEDQVQDDDFEDHATAHDGIDRIIGQLADPDSVRAFAADRTDEFAPLAVLTPRPALRTTWMDGFTLGVRFQKAKSQAELAEFKTAVRQRALQAAAEEGWCDDGLNQALRELGLEEKPPPRPRVRQFAEFKGERLFAQYYEDEPCAIQEDSYCPTCWRPAEPGDDEIVQAELAEQAAWDAQYGEPVTTS